LIHEIDFSTISQKNTREASFKNYFYFVNITKFL
jgi:hypothetical protein